MLPQSRWNVATFGDKLPLPTYIPIPISTNETSLVGSLSYLESSFLDCPLCDAHRSVSVHLRSDRNMVTQYIDYAVTLRCVLCGWMNKDYMYISELLLSNAKVASELIEAWIEQCLSLEKSAFNEGFDS